MTKNHPENSIKKNAYILRKKLFGAQKKEESSFPSKKTSKNKTVSSDKSAVVTIARSNVEVKHKKSNRNPYFIQIGFDFGTAFSKCIIRDVGTDSARVFVPKNPLFDELPFLLPSLMHLNERKISLAMQGADYSNNNLPFIKMALADIAQGDGNSDYMRPYQQLSSKLGYQSGEFVKSCAIFYLAQCFGLVYGAVKKKYTDFGRVSNDTIYINVPIPVGNADHQHIQSTFNKIVGAAWCIKENFTSLRSIDLKEIKSLLKQNLNSVNYKNNSWFLYPEISANVQGYVRSRTSETGIYLFVDTGAGTVDQAVFIFSRTKGDNLAYYSAEVSSLGSSFIELKAMKFQDKAENYSLNQLKLAKENGKPLGGLNQARFFIRKEVKKETLKVLTIARNKLTDRSQLEDVELIFGGGGHCENPYELGVKDAFRDNLFSRDLCPPSIGLPAPSDLAGLPSGRNRDYWIKRLSVAYGLSFPKYELTNFDLPTEIPETVQINRKPPPEYADRNNWQGHGIHN